MATRPTVETKTIIVKKGEVYQGIRFPAGTELSLIVQNNSVSSAYLHQDFEMNGHLLKSGTHLRIWDDGVLFEIGTRGDQKIDDLVFSEGEATITFSRKGKLERIHLNKNKKIRGLEFVQNYDVEFHPEGSISRGTVANDQIYDGFFLKPLSEIRFFPSGKVTYLKLAKESKWKNLSLKGDPNPANPEDVEFYPNGKMKKGILAHAVHIQGILCGPGPISFFESGNLKTVMIGENRKIELNPYPGQAPAKIDVKIGDRLTLNEDGQFIGWGDTK